MSAANFNNQFVLQVVIKIPEKGNFLNLANHEHTCIYKMPRLLLWVNYFENKIQCKFLAI